ncbi:MAG: hypothetical protein K6E51_10650 [Treponema sp.]|nr:hypothetical protein [Treponema sp.]
MKRLASIIWYFVIAIALSYAVDPALTIKLRYRTRMDFYKQETKNGSTTREYMNQRGYGESEDELFFSLAYKWAGVVLDCNVCIPESTTDAATTTDTGVTETATSGTVSDATTASSVINDVLSIDNYYGWTKIGSYWTLTAGKFSQSNVPLANWASTEISLTGSDDYAKTGINKNIAMNGGQRLDYYGFNFSYRSWKYPVFGNASNTFAGGIFNLALQFDTDPFLFRVAAVEMQDGTSTYGGDTASGDNFVVHCGLHAETAIRIPGSCTIDVLFKNPVKDQYQGSVFFTPTFLGRHVLTLGGTYVQQDSDRLVSTTNTTYNPAGSACAVPFSGIALDLRLGLRYGNAYRFVLMANYTSLTPSVVDSLWDNTKDEQSSAYFVVGISDSAWEYVTLKCDAALLLNDLDNNDKKDRGENQIKVCPSIKFAVTWYATMSFGAIYTKSINNADLSGATIEIEVPFVFRVQL